MLFQGGKKLFGCQSTFSVIRRSALAPYATASQSTEHELLFFLSVYS